MAAAAARGRLSVSQAQFLLCDVQEKFRTTIAHYPAVIEVGRRLTAAARLLDIPTIVTEQYPKAFGATVAEIDVSHARVFPKTQFSMVVPPVLELLTRPAVVLYGIEAHICVQQTALDLLDRGFDVHVVADGTSSRGPTDRLMAFQRMRQAGAFLTTCESVLFTLLQDAKHPQFKAVQKLIVDLPPEPGLFLPLF